MGLDSLHPHHDVPLRPQDDERLDFDALAGNEIGAEALEDDRHDRRAIASKSVSP